MTTCSDIALQVFNLWYNWWRVFHLFWWWTCNSSKDTRDTCVCEYCL